MKGHFSIPVLILNRAGITVTSLANGVGLSTAAVSLQLRGVHRPHPLLLPLIASLADVDVANEVRSYLKPEDSSPSSDSPHR